MPIQNANKATGPDNPEVKFEPPPIGHALRADVTVIEAYLSRIWNAKRSTLDQFEQRLQHEMVVDPIHFQAVLRDHMRTWVSFDPAHITQQQRHELMHLAMGSYVARNASEGAYARPGSYAHMLIPRES